MSLKIFISIATVLACLSASSAYAKHGYFGLRGGLADVHETDVVDEYVSTGFGSGYIGYYTSPFRAEIEFTVGSQAGFDKKETGKNIDMEAQFQRIMANAYLDINASRYVRPYIGGGIGTAFYHVKNNDTDIKESGNNFAWNAGAGVGIRLTRNVTFDTGYRYVDMGTVEFENKDEGMHFSAHEAYAGLRFLF